MALISIFPKTDTSPEQTAPEDSEVLLSAGLDQQPSHSVQRLQIGLSGLAAMVLLIGLAQVIFDRAQESDATAVPAAASTVAPVEVAPVQSDPLAEAGVVPDLPAEPAIQPAQEQAIMPELGPE